jgi:ABC-2 type transport system ATP-binding protein
MKISINKASKIIHGKTVLSDISLDLVSENIYGLRGYNGSGKTMLMRLLAGLILPTNGTVVIDGKQLGKDIDFPPSVGLLIENPAFLSAYTGFRNLQLLAQIKKIIADTDIFRILRDVGLDPDDRRKYKKYSLGMKQRLGIAAALMEKPDLLLFDEPMNALDSNGIELVSMLMRREKERGALIIMSCHDPEILETLSDCILTIDNGRLKEVRR